MKCNQKVNRKSLRRKVENYTILAGASYIACALCAECIPLCIAFFAAAGFFACKAIHLEKEMGN